MTTGIVCLIVGVVCIFLGIGNMRGNISSLHSYHTHRVKEEDKPAFGKLVGLGTILTGVGVALYGIFFAISILADVAMLTYVGIGFMAVGMVVGLGMSFYAMIKYNKGIF